MPLWSRKPSREAALQKIYSDAYQSSLQSILKESNLEYAASLDSWKVTLAQISSGMAMLDGTPPRTGQEKSLLASILDIERQCHDRIGSLTARLSESAPNKGNNPYGTHVSGSTASTSSVNLATSPQRKAVGSVPVLASRQATAAASGESSVPTKSEAPTPPPHKSKKWASLSESAMPRVKDMPYSLYSRKPNPAPSGTAVTSKLAASKSNSTAALPSTGKFKSAAEYASAASASSVQSSFSGYGRGMLSTLRSSNPLANSHSKPRGHGRNGSTPSPRSSGEDVATKSHQDLIKKTAQLATARHQSTPSANVVFNGFDSSFGDKPASPSTSSPVEASSSEKFSSHSSSNLSSSSTSDRRVNSYQITYTKVQQPGSSRAVYLPNVHRTSGPSQRFRPATTSQAAPQPASNPTSRSHSKSPRESQKSEFEKKLLVDDEDDEEEKEQLDDWDIMVREKIKDLRGVDEKAALQIVNEVVLKGDEVHWSDIAGLEKAKAGLKETVVYPFLRPDLFSGLREPALGMLLFGPPGTGKTMLARAVATESKSTFFSISASSLTSKYLGESEKLVRALFQLAKALAPSIIFVDEIDSILTQRADSGEHEASRRIKNEFLVQWSDLQAAAVGKQNADSNVRRVLVLGATNLPWAIDEAARRRFVRRQYIPLPETETRRVHLNKLLSHQKHALTDADIEKLVVLTEGYSGSDLTALAKDAAMGPLRSLGDALLTTAPDQVRPMGVEDFTGSMQSIRPSVSPEGLSAFENWAKMYGSSGA